MTIEETGYAEALELILEKTVASGVRSLPLEECLDCVAAKDVFARVNAPSADTSLKDGYAVNAAHLCDAGPDSPVRLTITGGSAAGQKDISPVAPGCAVRILTGGRIPPGADAVVAQERVKVVENQIELVSSVETGRNILFEGKDIKTGEPVVRKGDVLTPGNIGYLATGGLSEVGVYPRPSVAVIATGDEVLMPGQALLPGKLYASNLLTVDSWCRRFGMTTRLDVSGDDPSELEKRLRRAVESCDAVITSGGAWTGDKDLMATVLNRMGWKKCFHRLRLGPGKAAGFGLLDKKPFFILPGGPPSSIVAFLTLALPGLLNMSGFEDPVLPQIPVRLTQDIKSHMDWTHAEFGRLEITKAGFEFYPIGKKESRLRSIAAAQALMLMPQGVSMFNRDDVVWAYDLR